MNALLINEYGPPENLIYDTTSIPTIRNSNDIIINVKAAGVNPADFKIRYGYLALPLRFSFPIILGVDYAGVVHAVGDNVFDFKPGDAVYGKFGPIPSNQGTYAEYCRINTKSDTILHKPDNISFEEAAGVGVGALTAYTSLVHHGGLSVDNGAHTRVLVIGAAGGVGNWAVQIAHVLGAHVTAICSSPNIPFVLSLGADETIDYKKVDLKEELSAKEPFDIVVDTVGGDEYWKIIEPHIKPKGMYSTAVGHELHGGHGPLTISKLLSTAFTLAPRFLLGRTWYYQVITLPTFFPPVINEWLRDGKIKSFVKHTFPLKDGRLAHEQSESNRTVGKIVLIP
ncbi:chaperonin 10-like protein [Globomyces pollinis-pini]|nr:chaperonin 10-like protein [Globomyces pollinis-pini]